MITAMGNTASARQKKEVYAIPEKLKSERPRSLTFCRFTFSIQELKIMAAVADREI